MRAWDEEFQRHLLAATNYRHFISLFLKKQSGVTKPVPQSYQTLANRAGFKSKSFINDVIAGRKSLTPSSFEKLSGGLNLPMKWKEYFHCLVACEELAFQTPRRDAGYFKDRLPSIKARLAKTSIIRNLPAESDLVRTFLAEGSAEIYAALGSPENGASLLEIQNRTKLSAQKISQTLSKMLATGLVRALENGNFTASSNGLDFSELGSSAVMKQSFLGAVDHAKARFDVQAGSDRALFMRQTFSVKSNRLKELQLALRRQILEFADSAESSDGDTIGEIVIAFTS